MKIFTILMSSLMDESSFEWDGKVKHMCEDTYACNQTHCNECYRNILTSFILTMKFLFLKMESFFILKTTYWCCQFSLRTIDFQSTAWLAVVECSEMHLQYEVLARQDQSYCNFSSHSILKFVYLLMSRSLYFPHVSQLLFFSIFHPQLVPWWVYRMQYELV